MEPCVRARRALLVLLLVALSACRPDIIPAPTSPPSTSRPPTATRRPTPPPTTQPLVTTAQPAASPTRLPTRAPEPSPAGGLDARTEAALAQVSEEEMFATLTDLTSIQAYSGWRNSGTQGEGEALDYVAQRLGTFAHLETLGLELERQHFNVFLATETWETGLQLQVDGQPVAVPAAAQRGHRDDVALALKYDSDGRLNDTERNPVTAGGTAVVVHTPRDLDAIGGRDLSGSILLLDYALVDGSMMEYELAYTTAGELIAQGPAGIVLVTTFSNEQWASHGAFAEEGAVFSRQAVGRTMPILIVRYEDLQAAGIAGWDALARVESAQMTWDADVLSPAPSGNLVARIPGADSSRALILGAHIDSPNNPGAMDDGSGSTALLEAARSIDAAGIQPATDVYLVWFGSEELSLYGSYYFVTTHQELLDRTVAMLNMDCLTRPLDGIEAVLMLNTWSYGRFGNDRLLWPDYLAEAGAGQGVVLQPASHYYIESDNTGFSGFDVPNVNLIYLDEDDFYDYGGPHYAGHLHDPYDTPELVRDVRAQFVAMARTAVIAALEPGYRGVMFRTAPRPDRRAVFVASHTEAVHMSPTTFTDLGMALAMQGFDVDLVPYGQAVTAADVAGADLVVVLPVLDLPSEDGDVGLYDEAWNTDEVTALEQYVAQGGLLVLANTSHRYKSSYAVPYDFNEDWADANALAEPLGIRFTAASLSADVAFPRGYSALVQGVDTLALAENNAVAFVFGTGEVLAEASGEVVVALVGYGSAGGQVLVLGDVGILAGGADEPANLRFWQNIAEYARAR